MVLATEKKQKSILYDEQSIHKIEMITKNIGMVYSGMGPDYRWVFFCFRSFCRPVKCFLQLSLQKLHLEGIFVFINIVVSLLAEFC